MTAILFWTISFISLVILLIVVWIGWKYIDAFLTAMYGNATEKIYTVENGNKVTKKDDDGIDLIYEPTVVFKPVASRIYSVVRGESSPEFIMEFPDRLFLCKVRKALLDLEMTERLEMAKKIGRLNPVFFAKRELGKDGEWETITEDTPQEVLDKILDADSPDWNILDVPSGYNDYRFNGPVDSFLYTAFGFRLIGFIPWISKVQRDRFDYVKIVHGSTANGSGFQERKTWSNFFFASASQYGLSVMAAEDRDGIAVDYELVYKLRVRNPEIAGYGVERWLDLASSYIHTTVVSTTRRISFTNIAEDTTGESPEKIEEALKKAATGFTRDIRKAVLELNNRTPGSTAGCINEIGIEFLDVMFKKIDPDKEMIGKIRDAMTKPVLARLEAKKVVTLARAAREAAKQESDGVKDLKEAYGTGADTVLAFRELKGTNITVLGSNATPMINIPQAPKPQIEKGEENDSTES